MRTTNIVAFPAALSHSLSQKGGRPMEVKHIHPAYKSGEERREQLADAQRVCLKLIRDLRGKEPRGKERPA